MNLPTWPRFLSREMAAHYLGVSTDVFDAEVKKGMWPQALHRGASGRKLTWDRVLLDAAADRASGVEKGGEEAATSSPSPGLSAAEAQRRIHATLTQKRIERRPR